MSPTIHTPVKGFTGNVVGVDFKDGVGETDSIPALGYFERHGYKILADEKPKEPTERELLIAEAKALDLDTKGKNDEIKARIAEHKANAAKTPSDPQTPPADGESKGSEGEDGQNTGDADGNKGEEQK